MYYQVFTTSMKVIAHWFIIALALLAAAEFVPGIEVASFYIALIVALIVGILNVFVRPLLILLTLPITLLTLGLFTFVINALLFWFVATFVDGFSVDGFIPAFIGSLILTLAGSFSNALFRKHRREA